MANTQIKIKVESASNSFKLFDVTGSYSSLNPNGWGLPNDVIASAQGAVIRVTLPNSLTAQPDVSVFPDLPNVTNVGFEILPADLGLEDFPPGIYKFEYRVRFADKTLSQSAYFFHYEPLECCISKKKGKLSLTDASSDESRNVQEMEMLLENAIWAACSGDIDSAKEITELIWTRCGCCC
jgi:hypothetical protein